MRIILFSLSIVLWFYSLVSCSAPMTNDSDERNSAGDLRKDVKENHNKVIEDESTDDEKYSMSITPFITQFFTNLGFDKARMKEEAVASAKDIQERGVIDIKDADALLRCRLRWSLAAHDQPVYAIDASPNGSFMVSSEVCYDHDKCAHQQHIVSLWDLKNFSKLVDYKFKNSVWAVAFSPDSKYIAAGDGCVRWPCEHNGHSIQIIDVITDKTIATLIGHTSDVYSLSFSPDGKYLASGGRDKLVRIWDTSTWTQIKSYTYHTDSVFTVFFTQDGNFTLSGSADGRVMLVRWSDAKLTHEFAGHNGMVNRLAVSPDGTKFVSGGEDMIVRVWSLSSYSQLYALSGHSGSIKSVAFSPNGKIIATGSSDKTLKLWDAGSGSEIHTFSSHYAGYVNAL
jgi:WD40 repeat protein